MAANTAPIFPLTGNVGFGKLTAANTNTDGTGTVLTLFTAGAEGGRVDKIRCRALGTNVATVVRIYLNNGSTTATATNNSLFTEKSLPATTASNSAEIGPAIDIDIGISIPTGYTITVCIGTAVSAGWQFTCFGGNY